MTLTVSQLLMVTGVTVVFVVIAYLIGWFDGQSYLYQKDRRLNEEKKK